MNTRQFLNRNWREIRKMAGSRFGKKRGRQCLYEIAGETVTSPAISYSHWQTWLCPRHANSPDFRGSLLEIGLQKRWGLCKFHPKMGVPGPFRGVPGWVGGILAYLFPPKSGRFLSPAPRNAPVTPRKAPKMSGNAQISIRLA